MLVHAFHALVVASSYVRSFAFVGAPTPREHARHLSNDRARSADADGVFRAPDGAPGFGTGRTRRDLEKLMRSPSDAEQAMLDGLRTLALDVDLELARLDRRYVELGYDRLLA